MCAFNYIVDFLQDQRTDPSTFPFDVELAQLMPVGLDRTDFLDGPFDIRRRRGRYSIVDVVPPWTAI